jgi:hypothetical protein
MMKDINLWFVVVTSYNPGQHPLGVFCQKIVKIPAAAPKVTALPFSPKNKKAGQMAGFRRELRDYP